MCEMLPAFQRRFAACVLKEARLADMGKPVSRAIREGLGSLGRRVLRSSRHTSSAKEPIALSPGRVHRAISRAGLFVPRFYLLQQRGSDLRERDSLGHYVSRGEREGLKPNRFFDPTWYRKRYMDQSLSDVSALLHYIRIGTREKLWPGPDFDPAAYLAANPDVASAGLEPLRHFLLHGAIEGRQLSLSSRDGHDWFGRAEVHVIGDHAGAGVPGVIQAKRALELAGQKAREGAAAVLHILHAAGGGTARAVAEQIAKGQANERNVVLMIDAQPPGFAASILLPAGDQTQAFKLRFADLDALAPVLTQLNIHRAVVHQPLGLMSHLEALLSRLSLPHEVYVHDYTLLCPRSSFVTTSGRYCQEPDAAGCLTCLKQNPRGPAAEIGPWRDAGSAILRGATQVLCSGEDSARRVLRYVPEACTVVAPLQEMQRQAPYNPRLNAGERLRVAIIGHCSTAKGGDFLLDCVEVAQRQNEKIDWSVVGSFAGGDLARARRLRHAISVTGTYAPDQLSALLLQLDPHLLFFPQHCVETWSYSLTEAIETGRPILAASLGAIGERVRDLDAGHLFDEADSAAQVVGRIAALRAGMIMPQ